MILWIKLHSHGIAIVCNLFGVSRMEWRNGAMELLSRLQRNQMSDKKARLFIVIYLRIFFKFFFSTFSRCCFSSFALCLRYDEWGRCGTFDFWISYYLISFIFLHVIFLFNWLLFFAQISHKAICFDFKFNFPNKLTHFPSFYYLYMLASLICNTIRLLTCVHKHINRILRRLFVMLTGFLFHFFLFIIYWLVFDDSIVIVIPWKSIKSFVWHCGCELEQYLFFRMCVRKLHLVHSGLISIEKVLWLRSFVAFHLSNVFVLSAFVWVCVCVRADKRSSTLM